MQISATQQALLQQIRQRQTACRRLVRRVTLLLALAANPCPEALARQVQLTRLTVRLWPDRCNQAASALLQAEQHNASQTQLLALIEDILGDDDRSGTWPLPVACRKSRA